MYLLVYCYLHKSQVVFLYNVSPQIVKSSATSFFTRFSHYFIILDPTMMHLHVKKWLKYVVYGTQINRLCQDNSWKIAGKNFYSVVKFRGKRLLVLRWLPSLPGTIRPTYDTQATSGDSYSSIAGYFSHPHASADQDRYLSEHDA